MSEALGMEKEFLVIFIPSELGSRAIFLTKYKLVQQQQKPKNFQVGVY